MKKCILALAALFCLEAYAEDFPYLTFETTDGAKVSFASRGLAMGFSENILNVGQETFEISNLSKMYFSATNETSGISQIELTDINSAAEIYDLQGNRVQTEMMSNGIYMIRDKNATYKVIVK